MFHLSRFVTIIHLKVPRSGDTPAAARKKMVSHPPHILITTPESLNIMLSTRSALGMFGAIKTVILDEVHAIAGSKRGALPG